MVVALGQYVIQYCNHKYNNVWEREREVHLQVIILAWIHHFRTSVPFSLIPVFTYSTRVTLSSFTQDGILLMWWFPSFHAFYILYISIYLLEVCWAGVMCSLTEPNFPFRQTCSSLIDWVVSYDINIMMISFRCRLVHTYKTDRNIQFCSRWQMVLPALRINSFPLIFSKK